MAYNTFNLPELTVDLPPTHQNKNECVILGERKYHLNKSKCKFISVGLAYDFDYDTCLKLSGTKCDAIIFNRDDWKCFLRYQGVITNYLYANEQSMEPIDAGKFRIEFEKTSVSRYIRILKNNSYVCLGYETVCKLWEYIPVIEYRLDILERLQFKTYFNIVQKGLQCQIGNVFENALNLLRPSENHNSENMSMIMELIYIFPEVFEAECGSKTRK